MPNCLLVCGICLIMLGELIHWYSLEMPTWLVSDNNATTIGLFKSCLDSECGDIVDPPSGLKHAKGLGISAAIFGVFGFGPLIFMYVLRSSLSERCVIASGFSIFIAFSFIVANLILFSVDIQPDFTDKPGMGDYKTGYSQHISIAACILMGIGGILETIGGLQQAVFNNDD